MQSIDQLVQSVVSHLSEAASSSAVAGEPIRVGDVTLVVLSTLSAGMGAGGGEGRGEIANEKRSRQSPGTGLGEGAGGAVKVRPAAVVAFTDDDVQVLTIPAAPGMFDKVVERVPEVVDMVEQARHAFD
ncbi:MAG: hypothetical protein KTR31_29605 [Myxococcales bacterium]|nr:hypothetical protein [Myxococcales bacterium]